MAFVTAAKVEDLQPGVGKGVIAGGKALALFFVDGAYYAVDAQCPHRSLSLVDGTCAGGELTCSFHGAKFKLATGELLGPPAKRGIKSYPVRVEGGMIQVDV
jgi:nitrite reductase/ring-hydroxylating ferredoxin subunit